MLILQQNCFKKTTSNSIIWTEKVSIMGKTFIYKINYPAMEKWQKLLKEYTMWDCYNQKFSFDHEAYLEAHSLQIPAFS